MRLEVQDAPVFPVVRAAVPNAPQLAWIATSQPGTVRSGGSLQWPGVLVEKHIYSAGERVEASADRHLISLLCGRPARFEYRSESGRLVACAEPPGSVTIMPAGRAPEVWLQTSSELVHCALDGGFIHSVLAEMERPTHVMPAFRVGLRDQSIQRILSLLGEELDAAAPAGRLYVESLAHALATRYLLIGGTCGAKSDSPTSPLPARILNRVCEKIAANLQTDVSLEALAEESGYSRAHFLRMFRVATGITPHQYVLDARLNYVQKELKCKNATLIDIAASSGFSSQSHMTSVFRKRLGVTPAEFRRSQ